MVQLTRIYTKSGDKGKTSLGVQERVDKFHPRIEAIGAVDEANAAIGLACLYTQDTLTLVLKKIQNTLFDVGADLCVPEVANHQASDRHVLRVQAIQVNDLESHIDQLNSSLKPLTSFVLPGGSKAAAYLHQARTVVRRAERYVCALASQTPLNQEIIRYLNRLSDLLFVMARIENNKGEADVLWVPGSPD